MKDDGGRHKGQEPDEPAHDPGPPKGHAFQLVFPPINHYVFDAFEKMGGAAYLENKSFNYSRVHLV